MSHHIDLSEGAALGRLRADGPGPKPVVLVYTRQSVSDFDDTGVPRRPSLNQQFDAVIRRPELQGLTFEHFQDADRSGKETSKRAGYLAMWERIHTAMPGEIGAIAFYDPDRLHRNALEFFRFMAECEERRVLVFDANGLIRSDDELSWGIKAVVASAERRKIAKRVRDNLRFLKRHGQLLGTVPQGYRRESGRVVEDPSAGPLIREIFQLYSTGQYSFNTLAEHLNQKGIRPPRGPEKAKHNRPPAQIFTGDVLKDILNNPVYLGKIRLDGQLVDGTHPALVDQDAWNRCADVRARHLLRKSRTWTRYPYPLKSILVCGRCGSPMRGEAQASGGYGAVRLYYSCAARRRWSAREPSTHRCDAPFVRAAELEEAVREELRRCLPSAALNEAHHNRLRQGLRKARDPERVTAAALQRIDAQIGRVKQMYEWGHLDTDEYMAKLGRLNEEKQRLRQEAMQRPKADDLAWCETQILDMLKVWDQADTAQRSRLVAALFEALEVEARSSGEIAVVAVPRPGWKPFFAARVGNQRVYRFG